MQRSKPIKLLCWLCIALAANTCTYELCLALNSDPAEQLDSTDADVEGIEPTVDTFTINAMSDSLMQTDRSGAQPVYRKWWFWAIGMTLLITAAILFSGDEDKVGREDLPDFPEPPDR